MKIQNDLTKRLGIKFPIIQAPMILQKPLYPLAAAVSNAGGLGSLGCGEMSGEELIRNVERLRAATTGPFNLNFFLHQSPVFNPAIDDKLRSSLANLFDGLGLSLPDDTAMQSLGLFNDEIVSLLVNIRPAVVSFHFGAPSGSMVNDLKEAGILIFATATTVDEAVVLENIGVDVIVAQGWEAGGHRGTFIAENEAVGIGTLSLIPQVVDAVSIPVIAAGGIADGRGVAAALALGASGVQIGTAFLSCVETPISQVHRQTLRNVTRDDTVMTRSFSGRSCRLRRNKLSECVHSEQAEVLSFPLMYNYSAPLKQFGIANSNLDFQFLLYGQSASLNKEYSAGKFIDSLMCQAQKIFKSE